MNYKVTACILSFENGTAVKVTKYGWEWIHDSVPVTWMILDDVENAVKDFVKHTEIFE
jgi:hypothetical protein